MAGPQRLQLQTGWWSFAHALGEPEGGSGRGPQRGPTQPCFFPDTGVCGEMSDASLREGSLAGQCLRKSQASAQIGTFWLLQKVGLGAMHLAPTVGCVGGCVRSKALSLWPVSLFWGGWLGTAPGTQGGLIGATVHELPL